MSRPGASGREEGTPCRSRTFCQGPCGSTCFSLSLAVPPWVKRGEIMSGWGGLVELYLLFPQRWCHQIPQSCPTFRIPKDVGSRVGTEAGLPSQVTDRSLLVCHIQPLLPVWESSRSLFHLPIKTDKVCLGKKAPLDFKFSKSLFLCRPTTINLHLLLLPANLNVILSKRA